MIGDIVGWIQGVMLTLGPSGVLFLAFLQELVPPIPSTLVVVTAGFFFLGGIPLSLGGFIELFWMVGLPVALGLSVGSLIVYGIVYWGGRPIIEKYGLYLGVSWEDIERLQQYMRGHISDDVLLFTARALPIMPSVAINVFCGVVRWRPLPFFLHTFFGTIIRAMWAGFIGWEFGNVYQHYATVIENTQNIIFAVILVAFGGFLYYRKKRKSQEGRLGV